MCATDAFCLRQFYRLLNNNDTTANNNRNFDTIDGKTCCLLGAKHLAFWIRRVQTSIFYFSSYQLQYNEHKVFRLNFNVLRALVKYIEWRSLFASFVCWLVGRSFDPYQLLSFQLGCRVHKNTKYPSVSFSRCPYCFVRQNMNHYKGFWVYGEKPFIVSNGKYLWIVPILLIRTYTMRSHRVDCNSRQNMMKSLK